VSASHRRRQRRQALTRALVELRAAQAAGDEDLIWERTRTVLDWLYHSEEAERTLDPGYYSGRDADPRGKALAGLIWVRGLAVHHQAELRAAMITQAKAQTKLAMDATGIRVREAVAVAVKRAWPSRSQLPTGTPERRGRDVAYDAAVADKPLLPPLEKAAEYLLSLP
jgi:hypothetical protein